MTRPALTRGLALLAGAAWLGLALPAAARPFTAHDLVTMDRVSDPSLSPDGKNVVFDVRSTDLDADKGTHALWMVCTDCAQGGQQPVPWKLAASDKGATHPRFSADGKSVFFLSARSGSMQIWRTDIGTKHEGDTPVQVTSLPLPVDAFSVAPDGHRLVIALSVFPDCETPVCTKQRLDAAAKPGAATGHVYDKLFVRHWDEWADGRRNHLFALTLSATGVAAGEPVPLMAHFDGDTPSKPDGDEGDFAISPDSRQVVFSARLAGRTEPWSTNFDLYAVPMDGHGTPQNLTADNPAWDASPVFSPDGTKLVYRAMKRPGFEADRFGIMVRDLGSGLTHEIDADWDMTVESTTFEDNDHLLITYPDHGHYLLARFDLKTGKRQDLTRDGHIDAVHVAGGRVIFTKDSLGWPAEIYTLADGAPVQLTHIAAKALAGIDLAPYQPFTFRGWNNDDVSGFVMKPANYQPGRTYPVAYLIHGGPQSPFGDVWGYRWNPQFYAGLGFGVVFIEFHGTPGYGQAFTDSISGHWGDRPLEDLQKGWQAALAQFPFLDGNRACALGASYGGYMVDWIAGNWNQPFKCLVSHDGVFDNRIMAYSTDELWFTLWENGHLPPWQAAQTYEQFNPVDHVGQWRKPMLIIHSAQDFRISLDQGLAAFTALQSRGIPSELLTFPDENHWVLKPQNSLLWHKTVGDWITRWTGAGK